MNDILVKLDNSLNAILVKDLRQIVRGKFIWSTFIIYLALIVCVLGFPLLISDYSGANNGSEIALYMLGCLFLVSGLVVPLQLGKKTAEEVCDSTYELLFVTTMKPNSIVKGKFLGGMVTVIMLHAALAPFLAMTLFLGGLDLKYLALGIAYCFIVSNMGVLFQVFYGIFNGKNEGTVSLGSKVGVAILHFVAWCFTAGQGAELVTGRLFRSSTTAEMWTICFYFLSGCIILAWILFSLTVSKLEPEASNKSLSFKCTCSVIWIVGILISSFTDKYIETWTIVVAIALCFISVALLMDPDEYSNRVKSEIPKNPVTRLFNFPYFTGMANSICWILLTAICNIVVASFFKRSYSRDFFEAALGISSVLLYVNAIFLFCNAIRKWLWPTANKTSCVGMFVLIFLISTIAPIGSRVFFFGGGGWGLLSIISPFFAFIDNDVSHGLVTGFIFFIIAVMINGKAIFSQIGTYFSDSDSIKKPNIPIYKDNNKLEQS